MICMTYIIYIYIMYIYIYYIHDTYDVYNMHKISKVFDDSAAMAVPPSAAPSVPPVKIDLQIPPSVVAACKQVRALSGSIKALSRLYEGFIKAL